MPNKGDQGEGDKARAARRRERGPDRINRAKSRKLSAVDFEAVRPLLGISEDRIEAARLAMVDGKKLAEIAENYGWSRQAVDMAIRNVWNKYQKLQESRAIVAGYSNDAASNP